MGWFTKPATVEPGPRVLTPTERLAEVEKKYRASERALIEACQEVAMHRAHTKNRSPFALEGAVYCPVNLMNDDPVLARLEVARDEALRVRNQFLGERALLMKELKLIS